MATDFNETPGAARYRKSGDSSSLGSLMKNPIFKLMAIVVVGGGVAMAAVTFLSGPSQNQRSAISPGAEAVQVKSNETEVTQEYLLANQQEDQTRAEQAKGRGESAMPMPTQSQVANPTMDNRVTAQEVNDPLKDFENMISANQAVTNPAPTPAVAPTPQPTISPEALNQASRNLRGQMDMLVRQWEPNGMTSVIADNKDEASSSRAAAETQKAEEVEGRTIVNAGQVYYAQMLMEANSDVPGPIMAQILTGPLAGGRAIGTFQTFRNHLVIRFTTVAIRGDQLQVDILALDPDTTLGGVVTEVDPRYFTRVVLPAAAAFITAYGDAISEPDSTTTVSSDGISTSSQSGGNSSKDAMYKGVSEAANRVGEFVDEEAAATKRLVRVAVGTPIGLFFVSPVKESVK